MYILLPSAVGASDAIVCTSLAVTRQGFDLVLICCAGCNGDLAMFAWVLHWVFCCVSLQFMRFVVMLIGCTFP